jgi:NADPH-dependent F420 reductase
MESIGVVGGTGPEGLGLAMRFALAGHVVVIGSRSAERARSAAREAGDKLAAVVRDARVTGEDNEAAASAGDVVVLAVPWAAASGLAAGLAPRLRGKLVIDVVNPLEVKGGVFRLAAVAAGSAAEELQRLLPESQVVSAFKNDSAELLRRIGEPMHGDVLVCGDDEPARRRVIALIAGIAELRPVDAGALANARSVEAITALLLNLNRRHHSLTSIEILGLESRTAR